MTAAFDRMTVECELHHNLEINGRTFHARRRGDGVIWFEFEELCERPRSTIDYIEIARAFNTVVISNTPQLTGDDDNAARRFTRLRIRANRESTYRDAIPRLPGAPAPAVSKTQTQHRYVKRAQRRARGNRPSPGRDPRASEDPIQSERAGKGSTGPFVRPSARGTPASNRLRRKGGRHNRFDQIVYFLGIKLYAQNHISPLASI